MIYVYEKMQIKRLNAFFSRQILVKCMLYNFHKHLEGAYCLLVWFCYLISLIHCTLQACTISLHKTSCIPPHPGLWPGPYCATDLSLSQYVLNPGQKVAPLLVLPVQLQLDRPPPVVTHLTVLLCTQLEKEDAHYFLKCKFKTCTF